MSENNIPKHTRGVTLKEPKDIRRVCQRIVSKAFQNGEELEYSGRIAQLMSCWMKSWELEQISNLDRRIRKLEEAKNEHQKPQGKD